MISRKLYSTYRWNFPATIFSTFKRSNKLLIITQLFHKKKKLSPKTQILLTFWEVNTGKQFLGRTFIEIFNIFV